MSNAAEFLWLTGFIFFIISDILLSFRCLCVGFFRIVAYEDGSMPSHPDIQNWMFIKSV
nr:MAG TPA: hypothetical protein [Caudoviricetes sp.]